jgi:hypothetical protein
MPRQPVQSGHPQLATEGEAVEHAEKKLAPVGSCARHLLVVNVSAASSGSEKLVKLRVEGLPVGADAGVADKAVFGVSFDHILW